MLSWGARKIARPQQAASPTTADQTDHSHPVPRADRYQPTQGAPPVRCEPWDIGTGVTGYRWSAPKPRAVVLFQHGWGDYAQRWVQQANELIPHLVDEGFNVYAFDMRGNGRSPGRRGIVDVNQAISDHLAARHKLRQQPLPVFLVGHSLGGLVTATSMVRDQDDIAGVVLLAPAVKYRIGAPLRLLVRVGGLIVPTLPTPLQPGPPVSSDPAVVERFEHDPLMVLGRVSWLTSSGGATISHDNFRFYPSVRVPVLAIHGTADGSTDPTGSADLIAALASPDKSLHLVRGGHHALFDDPLADEPLRVVLDWLRSRVR